MIAQEKKEVGLALRCFENWKKAMPKLREDRMLRNDQEERIIHGFQKVKCEEFLGFPWEESIESLDQFCGRQYQRAE